jgi:arylsulfatase A-like enzyme
MALSGPGFREGGSVPGLVSLIDLPPTLLEAAGLPIPKSMEGHSLLSPDASTGDVFIQISESHIGRAVRTKRWKYSVAAKDAEGEYINGSSAPDAVVYTEDFLYDLASDPHEQVNLIGSSAHDKVCIALKERLLSRIKTIEGKSPEIKTLSRKPLGQRRIDAGEELL